MVHNEVILRGNVHCFNGGHYLVPRAQRAGSGTSRGENYSQNHGRMLERCWLYCESPEHTK